MCENWQIHVTPQIRFKTDRQCGYNYFYLMMFKIHSYKIALKSNEILCLQKPFRHLGKKAIYYKFVKITINHYLHWYFCGRLFFSNKIICNAKNNWSFWSATMPIKSSAIQKKNCRPVKNLIFLIRLHANKIICNAKKMSPCRKLWT